MDVTVLLLTQSLQISELLFLRECGSGGGEGASDEKENKRKDRRARPGDAHLPPKHPDAARGGGTKRRENGKQGWNSKNSQASIYKPSDADNVDRAEARSDPNSKQGQPSK